ncbi:MAG: hypothetical protein AAGH68_08800, partial [Pseudomonadota bacterium]
MANLEDHRAAAKSGTTKSLVILLHGYGADGADLFGLSQPLSEYMPGTVFRAPNAPEQNSVKRPAQTAERVGFTATRNCASDDPMKALRQMAFTASHADDIRMA